MELRGRVLNDMGRFELQVLYARAMTKLWEKIEQLREIGGSENCRFWHAAAAFVSVAGLVCSGHGRRFGR
jgi:hypothetical protein